jgi:hypothetical protein
MDYKHMSLVPAGAATPVHQEVPMEHRWGERVTVDVPVSLRGGGLRDAPARLCDFSMSGALVSVASPVPPAARVGVRIGVLIGADYVPGWIVRRAGNTFGVEWCQVAPDSVLALEQEARQFRHLWVA